MAACFPRGKQPAFLVHCIGTRKLSNVILSLVCDPGSSDSHAAAGTTVLHPGQQAAPGPDRRVHPQHSDTGGSAQCADRL